MKYILISAIAITCISAVIVKSNNKAAKAVKEIFAAKPKPIKPVTPIYNYFAKAKLKAVDIKTYAAKNKYCTDYCFLVDMRIPSSSKRFFVYDLKTDTILQKGLVTHGGGSLTTTKELQFCNVPSSGSTSLGKYKIGVEYSGQFGMAFKLHGLEPSNSKAFERFVVLHSHSCVPDDDVDYEICTSLGCPTVNPDYLPILKTYIDKADKPVLLCIYY